MTHLDHCDDIVFSVLNCAFREDEQAVHLINAWASSGGADEVIVDEDRGGESRTAVDGEIDGGRGVRTGEVSAPEDGVFAAEKRRL